MRVFCTLTAGTFFLNGLNSDEVYYVLKFLFMYDQLTLVSRGPLPLSLV
jgi:hypothetical protein